MKRPALRRVASMCYACGIFLGIAACSSGKNAKSDSTAAAPTRALERHSLDMDGDGVADEVTALRGDTVGHGAAGGIELRLSRAGTRVLDSGGHDAAPDEFNGNGNLLRSRLLYVADFHRAGRLLFLFGARVGCCEQSLTIYRLGATGPERYFHAREMWIDRSPIPQANTVAMIAGRELSKSAALPSSEFVSSVTYAPVIAYRLEEKPVIDSALSKALTREELGGFAGFASRSDVAALRRRDGGRVLWSLTEHRPMR